MTEQLVVEVDDTVLQRLWARAAGHGRTPAAEVGAILTEALAAAPPDPWAGTKAIFARLSADGRIQSDSADMIREDRDR